MSQPSTILVLCEDNAQERFVYGILDKAPLAKPLRPMFKAKVQANWTNVISGYPDEILKLRGRHACTWLIVIVDADDTPLGTRSMQLANSLSAKEVPALAAGELVAFLIPKYAIETWILYLAGLATLNEGTAITASHKRQADGVWRNAGARLMNEFRGNRLPDDAPSSLVLGWDEFQSRLLETLK